MDRAHGSAARTARAAHGRVRRDRQRRELSLRLPRLRGRDRSGARHVADRQAHRRRRRRPRGQSADHPRPDPRRHRAGRRAGAARAVLLRRRHRPAPVRLVHGLRDAARRHACRSSPPRSARCPRPRIRSALRPAGEGGTTPALGVVINAIVDALAEFGVEHIEMPATPERIWRALAGKPQRSRLASDELERERYGRQ